MFQVEPLSEKEEAELRTLLAEYSETTPSQDDIEQLKTLTSEIKAITNQAAILHGERIKKAQTLLKPYRDGAFSSWLVHAYGNRQTPYNFLQYYELYTSVSKPVQPLIDEMPRQAIYSLSSRNAPIEAKEAFIKEHANEGRQELLLKLRETFPLTSGDKRSSSAVVTVTSLVARLERLVKRRSFRPGSAERAALKARLLALADEL